MFLLRLASKNVFRKFWRSLITATPVLVGVMMTLLGWGLINGVDQAVIIGQIKSDSGHFRILAEDYLATEEDADLDHLVDDPRSVQGMFPAGVGPRLHPRLSFRGELSDGRQALTARGFGIEPTTYFADFALPLESSLAGEGQQPPEASQLDVSLQDLGLEPMWIGASLAADFGVQRGDILTVLARTRYGSYTAEDFMIAGLVRSQNPAIDNLAFFIPLTTAQELLDCDQAVSEVVGLLPSRDNALALPAQMSADLSREGLEIQTWRQRAEPILHINRMRRKFLGVLVAIIILVAATGIANTVVMAAFERIREIGTLRALGLQGFGVVRLFLLEALFIGAAGATAGCGLGVWIAHALRDGIDLTAMSKAGGANMSIRTVLYLEVDPVHVLIAFSIGLGATLLAALYPSIKFSRLAPMEAMRR